MKKTVVLIAILTCGVDLCFAQVDPEPGRTVTLYRHVEPGQSSIFVNVWGDVSSAGRYEVRAGTGLIELLFLAGGPGEKVQNSGQHRRSDILVSRREGAGWKLIAHIPLDELMNPTQPDIGLQNEDVVKVETHISQKFNWKDALTIIGTVGTLALIGDRVFR